MGLLGLSAAVTLAGCGREDVPAPQGEANAAIPAPAGPVTGRLDRSHAGTPAPDVTFQDPQGRPVTLAQFRGRPVLVNLWATWCAPCVIEMPSLEALARREGEALQVLVLSQDMGDRARELVTRFFAERRFEALEPYLDSDMAFMSALRFDTLPTTILYDAQGREVWRMTQIVDWTSDRAARLIDEAEAG